MITTEALARELDVTLPDVQVHVDQLIAVDGEDAVIDHVEELGTVTGSYPDVLVWITTEAADSVRAAVAATALDRTADMSLPYWPDDDAALAVWAAVGGTQVDLDAEPEDVVGRCHAHGYDWTTTATEVGLNPGMRRELAVTAAWAGIARMALRRRDDGVRHCVAAGAKAREVGGASSLSDLDVGRIVRREDSPRGRW